MKAFRLKKWIKGFSIIELLIAIIIIGILVAVIVPRLATRSELARQRTAKSDLLHIKDAQERAGIDTGYYYRLYVLDDNIGGDGLGTGDPNDVNDGIRDEMFNRIAQNPTRIFIDVNTGVLLPEASANILYQKLTQNETAFGWHGRYITWQKDDFGHYDGATGESMPNDIPDDPWNHDYIFFTPKGLVLEPQGEIVTSCGIDSNGQFFQGGPYDCLRFDRFTVLSLGGDGLPGSQPDYVFGTGDDIVVQW